MNHHFCILAAVLCLFLAPLGAGQEPIYFLSEEPAWGNPYPGLGNVSPGSAAPYTAPSSASMLNFDRYSTESQSELSPTTPSTELYLSRLPQKRTGMFQKVNFNTLWVPDTGGSKGLGMTELDLSAMFALPLPTPDSPLLITPKFGTTFFDSKGLDWNKTFYTTGLGLRWIRPIVKDKLTADLGWSAFYSGDFKAKGRDTMRFPIHLAGIWNFNPRTKIVFGVVYSDRRDGYNVFPMAGLIWSPHDDLSVELIVPRLRVAQRIRWFGSGAGDEQSDWLYTAFEFGSGSWGCDFWGLSDGRVEYRDLRLLLGYERRTRFGATLGLEVGYMFDRCLDVYAHGAGRGRPSDTVFLRLRTSF